LPPSLCPSLCPPHPNTSSIFVSGLRSRVLNRCGGPICDYAAFYTLLPCAIGRAPHRAGPPFIRCQLFHAPSSGMRKRTVHHAALRLQISQYKRSGPVDSRLVSSWSTLDAAFGSPPEPTLRLNNLNGAATLTAVLVSTIPRNGFLQMWSMHMSRQKELSSKPSHSRDDQALW